MDHLVQEIKENLKLGAPPPPPAPNTLTMTQQTEVTLGTSYPAPALPGTGYPVPPGPPGGGPMTTGKMKRSWTANNNPRPRSSPYHVPPSSRTALAQAAQSQCDSSDSAGATDVSAMAALRRKWATGRRRYPSTCMNNNAATAAATKNIDPDDPFAILQELISGGSLIKEAVRRLQKPVGGLSGIALTGSPAAGRMTPRLRDSETSGNGGRRTAYDSEDSDNEDCRTPPEDATVQQQQPPSVRNRSFPCCEAVGM